MTEDVKKGLILEMCTGKNDGISGSFAGCDGSKVDIFQEPLSRKMGEYIAKMHIDSMYFINFC